MLKSEATVILKKGRAQPVWQKHPWIYAGAIAKTEGALEPGSLVSVYDHDFRLIGRGFYNPKSQIAVRMATYKEEPLDPAHPEDRSERAIAVMIARRIKQAAHVRRQLQLPSEDTNAFRLIHSEGDRLPGITVDLYAEMAVVQFTTLSMKKREQTVYEALKSLPEPIRPRSIVEVSVPRFAQLEGFTAITRLVDSSSPSLTSVICKEAGLLFEVEPLSAQKTGMFLDQRENRLSLGKISKGLRFLDVYSYMGGFALQALRQGASSATCVDSSERALQKVEFHAKQNHLPLPEIVEQDAFRFLETVAPYNFDIVVVDPPKFASAQKDVAAALKGYRRLNALAMNAVAKGGLLASCSCSQLIDMQSFERMLAAASVDAGRHVSMLEFRFQGPDHPVPPGFPEGNYLKFVLMSVE